MRGPPLPELRLERRPPIGLVALRTLEVGHDDVAGVGHSVRNDQYAIGSEDLVCVSAGRTVGVLHDEPGANVPGVFRLKRPFGRCGN